MHRYQWREVTVRMLAMGLGFLLFASHAAMGQRTTSVVGRLSLDSLARRNGSNPVMKVGRGAPMTVPAHSESVSLAAGELLVHRSGSRPSVDSTLATPHFDLPTRIIAPTTAGSTASLTIAVESQGLSFSSNEDTFVGVIQVGLQDSLRVAASDSLATPVQILITSRNANVEVEPSSLVLRHTNLPFAAVRIRTKADAHDTVLVHIRPTFDPSGSWFTLPVVRPRLKVMVSPKRIAGFGLERSVVSVQLPAVVLADRTLSLSALRGLIDTVQLRTKPGAIASARVLSRGWGVDTIRAEAAQLAAGFEVLDYGFPWLFLVMAVLGGGLGAAGRSLRDRGHDRKWFARVAANGIVIGVIVATAYAIGINLTMVDLPTQVGDAATFVSAALGTLLGVKGMGTPPEAGNNNNSPRGIRGHRSSGQQ